VVREGVREGGDKEEEIDVGVSFLKRGEREREGRKDGAEKRKQ